MLPRIPNALLNWLREYHWSVVKYQPINGGFAASLYQLTIQTDTVNVIQAIYKQFAPGRAQEFNLYQTILPQLDSYAPNLLVRIQEGDELGILLEDVGQPLKSVIHQATRQTQIDLIRKAASWLATFHHTNEKHSLKLFREGTLKPYSLESSLKWGQEAINELKWLVEQGTTSITQSILTEVQAMNDWFYPRYPKWLTGRMTITHGDPHLENIMLHRATFKLIDWEYTCFTIPQRDVSIFLQDLVEEELFKLAKSTYWNCLREVGWRVDEQQFHTLFYACLYDNTLMMLGWEIYKFREGYIEQTDLASILSVKLRWLRESFNHLFSLP